VILGHLSQFLKGSEMALIGTEILDIMDLDEPFILHPRFHSGELE